MLPAYATVALAIIVLDTVTLYTAPSTIGEGNSRIWQQTLHQG